MSDATWIDACALADVEAAAAAHRGLGVEAGDRWLSVFRARDGVLTCVETPCPHAGHRLCDGYAADPVDVEDLVSDVGVLVACPAHAYVYDTKSGSCLASFGAGAGRAVAHAARAVDGRVLVDPLPARVPPRTLDKPTSDAVGMRCVELALAEKYPDE